MRKKRPLHAFHPTLDSAHPFKALSACKMMVRWGGFVDDTKAVTCKLCLKQQLKETKHEVS